MYDEIMFSIIGYIADLNLPSDYWNRDLFEQQCYSIWAAKELYYELSINEEKPAETVIDDFIKRMDEYSCKCIETSFMFSIARDTAIDILDIVRSTM